MASSGSLPREDLLKLSWNLLNATGKNYSFKLCTDDKILKMLILDLNELEIFYTTMTEEEILSLFKVATFLSIY
jgi:hypothetical protein